MDTNRITAAPAGPAGQVTTFYSYDSTPVRSLALAHAGWLLAGRRQAQTPVLMIDWDLDGPGLHHYFQHEHGERAGVLELFEACRDRLRADGGGARGDGEHAEAAAARVLDAIDWDAHLERVDEVRPLYLMRAGRFDDSYGERADRLDWDGLFGACPALFRSFAARLRARFAHVLIDCRGGRSAAASVCTALLPDKVVGLFTPDRRSLDGLAGVVARALDYRCSHEDEQRPLLVYPLPSPVDSAAEARLRWRLGDGQQGGAGYQGALEELLGKCYGVSGMCLDSYLDEVVLPQAGLLGAALPSGRGHRGKRDRLGAVRSIEALLEWLEPGHFPWRPLVEVRLQQTLAALHERAADPQAPGVLREMARLGESYLRQQHEAGAARRIERHLDALQQGIHAMEEGKRGLPAARRRGEARLTERQQ